MKDIKNAIIAEQQYIKESHDNPHLNLVDYLTPYGYTNITEYFEDKNLEYLHQNFNLYLDEPTEDIDQRVWDSIAAGESSIWVPKLENVLACVGTDTFDYDLAKQLNVGILEMPHSGGTIITGPDDLTIGVHFPHPDPEWVYNYFFNKMNEFLSPLGFEFKTNDFLFEGKKVIGCSAFRNGGKTAAFFFSATFTNHLDLIQQLCQKRSTKVPGYIDSSILSKEELKREVLSWLIPSI